MTIELTQEEKANIVEQHLKNIAFSEYNVQISLIEANSLANKDQASIDSLNLQLSNISAQKTALQAELNSLNTNQ